MTRKVIHISRAGTIAFVHDDRLRGLLNHGPARIRRASHVEPGDPAKGQDPLQWYADMSLSGGGILGPFPSRAAALSAEVEWINAHLGKEDRTHETIPDRGHFQCER